MTQASALHGPAARDSGAEAPKPELSERRGPESIFRQKPRSRSWSIDGPYDNVAERIDPLRCPDTWPAALYLGDIGAHCKVHSFGAAGAQITMDGPPPVGAWVALKFPFTIYLRGRIAWRDGDDAEIEFDEPAQRSARLVEEVLLDHRYAA